MITINNKYSYGDYVKYRIWDIYAQKFFYFTGNVVGFNYIDFENKQTLKYGIIRENIWENKEEIEALGASSDFEFYDNYVQKHGGDRCRVAIEWINENDLIE